MRAEKEQKVFFAVLWFFLVLSLVFFIAFLSAGRMFLPAPVIVTLLLLDIGFIVFHFIPLPGRVAHGPPGRRDASDRWYPRRLEEIVERTDKPVHPEPVGARAVVRTISPVPLIPLLLLLVLILLAIPILPSEEEWRDNETERLTHVYELAKSEIERLESLTARLCGEAAALVGGSVSGELHPHERATLVHRIDSLAASLPAGSIPLHGIGIQVFDSGGDRVAWGGRPRYVTGFPERLHDVRVFTHRTQLYTLLVRDVVVPDGRINVDIPLEISYRIHNQYLESTSLGEILSARYGREVVLSFTPGEHRGYPERAGRGEPDSEENVMYDAAVGAQVYGTVPSTTGLPLARLRVKGAPFSAVLREIEERRTFWARLVVTLIVAVIALWVYRTYGKRRLPGRSVLWSFTKRIIVLLFFLVVVRYLLLRLDLPSGFLGTNLFDPALYAGDAPGGLTRTIGDFLITALFALIFVFGTIKSFRTFYAGNIERPLAGGRRFDIRLFAGKVLLLTVILFAALRSAETVVSRTVINSNPRLIGLDVDFFEVPVTALHLALLFSVAAMFIAAIFAIRLVFIWGGGGRREAFQVSFVALVPCLFLFDSQWLLLAAAGGLLVLAVQIFPLLKKEEIVSVVFSSFFLVLICSLVIDSIAWMKYTDLRRSRLLETAEDFMHPEDNWLGMVLPDLCQDFSADRSIASRVLSKTNSLAFEIWAESMLSRYNLSCVTEVYDADGERFSQFKVGMPFGIPPPQSVVPGHTPGISVTSIEHGTREGTVYFYRGVAPVYHARGIVIGRVEITIPYFFENPELLARTAPMAPEILHNIEQGAPVRRIDEPENLLVARVADGRVADSSTPFLLSGVVVPAAAGGWFDLEVGADRYRCVIETDQDGSGYLVGYREVGVGENLLRWATLVSLDVILTVLSLAVLLLVRRLPILRSVTPDVSIGGKLGFRQKILASFLVVSILPVVIFGIFSGQFVMRRFLEESEHEALTSVGSAVSMLTHSIESEAESFAGSQYLGNIVSGKQDAEIRDAAVDEFVRYALFDHNGRLLINEGAGEVPATETQVLPNGWMKGGVMVTFEHPFLYGGVLVPIKLSGGSGGHLFYRRRLDDTFIGGIADVLGRDINIYYRGRVLASSERELFTGGFLEPLLDPTVFADVALSRSKVVVRQASLGDYSYHVASSPLEAFRGDEYAVLSVPMLYRPALVEKEVRKTSALILGLLALLFAATVILGFFLAGRIFNPIAALRGGTRRIIEGDLEFRLESRATDEIGELVDSFNTMTGALRDARRDLLERQRYLSAVLDNVATGVITADSEGRIVTINPSAERILGVRREQIVGREAASVTEVLRAAGLEQLFALISGEGEQVREEEISFRSEAGPRTVKAVVTSLVEGGERLGTVIVFDDLTELIRSKKLSAWIEMARQIAHEVKNPLTPIRLSVQLMRRAYDEKREEFGEIFESGVETVVQQTEILRRIASEFSSFGKVTSLRPERIPLQRFLRQFVTSYGGAEGVRVDLEDGGDVAVIADQEALRKILVNLMENALEAMPKGGAVTVAYKRAGEQAVICVLDTGTGLQPEIEEKLFEPYFSTKTNGTGLGLAICRNLAHEMEGRIFLRNREEGAGVEAVVTLPAAD